MSPLRIGIIIASILQIASAALHLYSLQLDPNRTANASLGWIALGMAGFLGIVMQFRPPYRHMAVPLNWICGFAFGVTGLVLLPQGPNHVDKWAITLFWCVAVVGLCLFNALGIPKLNQPLDNGAAGKEAEKDIDDQPSEPPRAGKEEGFLGSDSRVGVQGLPAEGSTNEPPSSKPFNLGELQLPGKARSVSQVCPACGSAQYRTVYP